MSVTIVLVSFAPEQFFLDREQFGMRFGLERTTRLLERLGRPDADLPAVHIVGTNGKSSTARFIAAALDAQGLTTGCFTSPHLRGFWERITVAGAYLPSERFSSAAHRVAQVVASMDAADSPDDRVTQFEAVWATALCAFRSSACDVIVAEAGLGGRLDATNTLYDSRVQVLTGIALDHTELLGETAEAIAAEKLAVVRDAGTLVHGRLDEGVRVIAARTALERRASLVAVDTVGPEFAVGGSHELVGEFVRRNASLALIAAEEMLSRLAATAEPQPASASLRRRRFNRTAALNAIAATADHGLLEGRLTLWTGPPPIVLDCAHNGQAAATLVDELPGLVGDRPLTLVVGVLGEKRLDDVLGPLMAVARAVVVTQPQNPRALPASRLGEAISSSMPDLTLVVEPDPSRALAHARQLAGEDGAVLVAGSNYLIADLVTDGQNAGSGRTAAF